MKEYVPPTLTVDTVVFQLIEGELCVLLIQRQNEPFKDKWALPGGYNAAGQTTEDAVSKVLQSKAGVDVKKLSYIEQLYTFDTIARDPRGHAVAVSYLALARNLEVVETKDTHKPRFFPVTKLPELAYDHDEIIKYAHNRLNSKLTYTNCVTFLLPKTFTFGELQSAYEAVFGRELDKRNFRKKFLSLDMISETGEMSTGGAHRPAKIYKFSSSKLQTLNRSFD